MEAHCHIGLDGYGSGNAGADYNETNAPVTPQLRAIDGINAMDPCLNMAAKAGITCFATGPGSTNALGGTFTAIKPNGKRVDNMIVKEAIAMKCAFGENPKRRYGDKKIATRMTNVALIRVAKEFGLDITLEHVTEGHLIVDDLVKENLPLAVGPSFGHASKFEMLGNRRYLSQRWLPCFHHHRRSCCSSTLSSALSRFCNQGRNGRIRCSPRNYDLRSRAYRNC